ncbi:MAG TPA: hypothetical protein VFL82_11130 [Thermomicrobiales bacterium]|nr:hypothetical protein [Thermomicrobiales bacterium]
MRRTFALAAALLLGLTLATPTLAQQSTPVAGASPFAGLDLPELQISASDSGYDGVPAQRPAGFYLVTFTNNASSDAAVDFLQLPQDVTFDEFTRMAAQGGPAPAPAASPEMGMATPEMMGSPAAGEEAGAPPDWYFTTYMAGGVGAPAGQSAQVVVYLQPGNYAVWGDDPTAPQAPANLVVTGETNATPVAAPAITADVTVTEASTTSGFAFQIDGDFVPGQQTVKVLNFSNEPHFMLLLKSPGPLTIDQAMQLIQLPENATPPAGLPNPNDFTTAALAATQSGGTSVWLSLNLEPGTYVMLCFVPDPNNNYTPHAAEGMVSVITVGGTATPVASPAS